MTENGTKEEARETTVEGMLRGNKVIISYQSDADSLAQSGYGVRFEKTKLSLALYEALFLLAEKRLNIQVEDVEVKFPDFLRKSRLIDPDIWIKYVLYRDLRVRGYIIREGSIGDIGFRVYERGSYPKKAAKYEVFPIREGNPISINQLNEIVHLTESSKKKLIVAVVDRHGEIVYYTLARYAPK